MYYAQTLTLRFVYLFRAIKLWIVVTIAPPPEVSADEVKELRQSLHMTQRTFAALMGVSNKTVEAWEKGTNAPAGTARRMMGMLIADHTIPEKYNIITR
jgi:putative transcriptional regulator